MFDPLSQYVTLQLSNSLTDQSVALQTVANGGTVFVDPPGRFKTNGLIFPGQITSVATVANGAGMRPGGDVESTLELFVRPSVLGGQDQVIASWEAAAGSMVRLVIRGGYYNIEVAPNAGVPRWRTIAAPAVAVVWDEWQFLAVIQEIDPARKFSLYAGVSGVCSLVGEVADSTPGGQTVAATLRFGAAHNTVSLGVRQTALFYTNVEGTGVGARSITLGHDAPVGVTVSITVEGTQVGGTVGAGQTLYQFLDAVVKPNIVAAYAVSHPGVVVSASVFRLSTLPYGVPDNFARLDVSVTGVDTTFVVAPIGTVLSRYKGNISEVRVTTVRRRYFDPYSTPPNQTPSVPVTSWDGGGAATLTRTLPKLTVLATGSQGGRALLALPKLTVSMIGTVSDPAAVGPADSGTVLVKRAGGVEAIVDGLKYVRQNVGDSFDSASIAVASMGRSTGKWYFEVGGVPDPDWPGHYKIPSFNVGILAAAVVTNPSADIGGAWSVGFNYGGNNGSGYYGDDLMLPEGSSFSFQQPLRQAVGVLFDTATAIFRIRTAMGWEIASASEWHRDAYGQTVPPINASEFLVPGPEYFPAVRMENSGATASKDTLTINFGASAFMFPEVLVEEGAEAYDTRPPYVGELAGAAALLPKFSCKGHSGAQAAVRPPQLKLAATGGESVLNAAELTAPSLAVSARSGHSASGAVPALQLQATGTVVGVGRATISLKRIKVIATGHISGQAAALMTLRQEWALSAFGGGHAHAALPMAKVTAHGLAGAVGRAKLVLPVFTAEAAGTREETGKAVFTLPVIRAVGPGRAALVLPRFTLVAEGLAEIVLPVLETYALNMRRPLDEDLRSGYDAKNKQATRYTNFPFTKIVRFGNDYYGMAADGLYLIGGEDDDGQPIAWDFETCTTDFGSPNKKTVVSAYVGGDIGPRATFTLKSGESQDLPYVGEAFVVESTRNHRKTFGRGRRERYYALGLAGTGALSVDSVEFEINTTQRRI